VAEALVEMTRSGAAEAAPLQSAFSGRPFITAARLPPRKSGTIFEQSLLIPPVCPAFKEKLE